MGWQEREQRKVSEMYRRPEGDTERKERLEGSKKRTREKDVSWGQPVRDRDREAVSFVMRPPNGIL